MSDKVKTCDSRCHNAKKPVCKCWCGGAFHGKAGQANREKAAQIISERFKIDVKVNGCKYIESIKQEKLF